MGFAGYFTLNALGPGVQRRTRLGEKTAATALTLSIGASMLVAVVIWAGASLWAHAWGIPDATWVIRVIGLTTLFTSCSIVPLALLRRGLRFRTAAVVETGALVIGLATGVALAAWLHSAVALALGQATGGAVQLLAAGVLARGDLALGVDRADARELLRFSSQVSGLNLFHYFNYAAPSWFAARTFGAAALGVYSRASLIVGLPSEYALTSIYKVIYPVYGRVRDDLARTRVLIDEALTLTTGLLWPMLALIAGAAPVIVAVLLGGGWGDAPQLVALFALMASAWVPCGVLTNAAEAQGWMRIIAWRLTLLFGGVIATLVVASSRRPQPQLGDRRHRRDRVGGLRADLAALHPPRHPRALGDPPQAAGPCRRRRGRLRRGGRDRPSPERSSAGRSAHRGARGRGARARDDPCRPEMVPGDAGARPEDRRPGGWELPARGLGRAALTAATFARC